MRIWAIVAAVVVVVGGGVAAAVGLGVFGRGAGAPALVPQDAVAYVHAMLAPSLGQKQALASLAERLPQDAQDKLKTASR